MKTPVLIIALALTAACTPRNEETTANNDTAAATQAPPPVTSTTDADATSVAATASASGSGIVEAIDPAAGTVTIAHGPVEALQWPPMTMTFPAPDIDLASIKPGDRVTFELTQTGPMEATITRITAVQAAQ